MSRKKKRWLVTGAAGFIGSNFVRQVLREEPDVAVISLDALTYAGNPANLEDCRQNPNFRFIRGDICDADTLGPLFEAGLDVVINFAAESHVDRSILGCQEFIRTNIQGTQVLLDQARAQAVPLFVQISTDEVYGSLGATGLFTEETPLAPNSPYSASKAGADLLVRYYYHTFELPVIITRCSNNYGPYQFPEKLIPLFITNLMEGKKVPVYGDGQNVRDWIHVEDHCRAIRAAIAGGRPGEVYNIGADSEKTNLEITRLILSALEFDESMIQYVRDRPGHDRRYAIDSRKAGADLGWSPQISFEEGIEQTIMWYRDHRDWWQQIKSGKYLEYYEQQYSPT